MYSGRVVRACVREATQARSSSSATLVSMMKTYAGGSTLPAGIWYSMVEHWKYSSAGWFCKHAKQPLVPSLSLLHQSTPGTGLQG